MSSGKILVVEDDYDLRSVCRIILTHAGYSVSTAVNGQEGLEEVDSFAPDLVLLDIFMPIMDGKSFLEQVDLSAHPGTHVIVYSNTSDSALMKEMVDLGADKVVNKSSLAPTDLIKLVEPYFAAKA